MLEYFSKGLVVGFTIAAPVGPIGVLCIRRSLAQGMAMGFVSGLGAATADALYGCVAGFGLTAISNFLVGQKFWLGLLGGAFLCYLGVKTFLDQGSAETKVELQPVLEEMQRSMASVPDLPPARVLPPHPAPERPHLALRETRDVDSGEPHGAGGGVE